MNFTDVETQSEHFLIKLDGEFLTGGEHDYKNEYVGNWWDFE